MKDVDRNVICVHVCIHASQYVSAACCEGPGAKWSQIVPVRLQGQGVEEEVGVGV